MSRFTIKVSADVQDRVTRSEGSQCLDIASLRLLVESLGGVELSGEEVEDLDSSCWSLLRTLSLGCEVSQEI